MYLHFFKDDGGNGKFVAHVPRARKTIVQIGEFKHFYVIFSAISW